MDNFPILSNLSYFVCEGCGTLKGYIPKNKEKTKYPFCSQNCEDFIKKEKGERFGYYLQKKT